jgi:hypothetical protein
MAGFARALGIGVGQCMAEPRFVRIRVAIDDRDPLRHDTFLVLEQRFGWLFHRMRSPTAKR